MKKILLLLSIICFTLAFTACGNTCEHSFNNWEIITQPTCIEDGLQSRICRKCSYTEETILQKKGHSYSEGLCVDCFDSDPNDNVIAVFTPAEFINAIGNNKTIKLMVDEYVFSENTIFSNSFVEKSISEYSFGFYINGISNLTIVGEAVFNIEINSNKWFSGFYFKKSNNISIDGLLFKSTINASDTESMTAPYYISFYKSNNINVQNCQGAQGYLLSFTSTTNAVVENCTLDYNLYIFESSIAINSCRLQDGVISSQSEIEFNQCVFENMVGVYEGSYLLSNFQYDISTQSLYEKETSAVFNNCEIKNNTVCGFFANEIGFEEYSTESIFVEFNNCHFYNNLYCFANFQSNNYSNCIFSNNTEGYFVPTVIGYAADDNINFVELEVPYEIEYVYEESDMGFRYGKCIDQSVSGIVPKNTILKLTISKPAIEIDYISIEINSAGGVRPSVKYKNNSDKQIAYIYFRVKFYDRMGYPAYCEVKDTCQGNLKFTGPLNPNTEKTSYFEPVIYNNTTAAVKITSIDVVFADGSMQTIANDRGIYWYMNSYYGGILHD